MSFSGALFFFVLTVLYVWNGKDRFYKKDWLDFLIKFVGVFIVMIIFGFIMKGAMYIFPEISVSTARYLTKALGASLMTLLLMKFLVVMLCQLFSTILGFHKENNKENYEALSSLSNKAHSPLLLLAKCIVSFGSILVYHGIWLI